MNNKESHLKQDALLRQRAEEITRGKAAPPLGNLEALSSEEFRLALHELQVHQIELKMQNEELRRTQVELDTERARYFDLYDLAPVGYVTLSEKGLILEANLTASGLLGIARGELIKQPFSSFIQKEDADTFYLQIKQVIETGTMRDFELRMVKKHGTLFWAHLVTTLAQDAEGVSKVRIAISDITERKEAEAQRDTQLLFTTALNKIAQVIISQENSEELLERANQIIGETLQVDRTLINDVSFEKNQIIGLCEWLKQENPDIAITKDVYPLELFLSPFSEMRRTKKYLESHSDAVNEHFTIDGSGKIPHGQMKIKSLL